MTSPHSSPSSRGPARHAPIALAALAATLLAGCPTSDVVFTTGGGSMPAERGRTYRWNFDDLAPGAVPPDFINVLGSWSAQRNATAPSMPNVFRQTGAYHLPDFPRIVVRDLTFTDPRAYGVVGERVAGVGREARCFAYPRTGSGSTPTGIARSSHARATGSWRASPSTPRTTS